MSAQMDALFPDGQSQRVAVNQKHAENPEVGDYWTEMFAPTAIVVMVDADWVCIQRNFKGYSFTIGVDPKPHVMSRKAFNKWLRYDTIPDKTWCDVEPRRFAKSAR